MLHIEGILNKFYSIYYLYTAFPFYNNEMHFVLIAFTVHINMLCISFLSLSLFYIFLSIYNIENGKNIPITRCVCRVMYMLVVTLFDKCELATCSFLPFFSFLLKENQIEGKNGKHKCWCAWYSIIDNTIYPHRLSYTSHYIYICMWKGKKLFVLSIFFVAPLYSLFLSFLRIFYHSTSSIITFSCRWWCTWILFSFAKNCIESHTIYIRTKYYALSANLS